MMTIVIFITAAAAVVVMTYCNPVAAAAVMTYYRIAVLFKMLFGLPEATNLCGTWLMSPSLQCEQSTT